MTFLTFWCKNTTAHKLVSSVLINLYLGDWSEGGKASVGVVFKLNPKGKIDWIAKFSRRVSLWKNAFAIAWLKLLLYHCKRLLKFKISSHTFTGTAIEKASFYSKFPVPRDLWDMPKREKDLSRSRTSKYFDEFEWLKKRLRKRWKRKNLNSLFWWFFNLAELGSSCRFNLMQFQLEHIRASSSPSPSSPSSTCRVLI